MSDAVFNILRKVTTATITTMLLRKGIRRCWMNGPKPLVPKGERIVGRAFTLRFVPVREDLATVESWAHPVSTRAAIEEMPEGWLWSQTPWVCRAPAYSATFFARACASAALPRSSPMASCAIAAAF